MIVLDVWLDNTLYVHDIKGCKLRIKAAMKVQWNQDDWGSIKVSSFFERFRDAYSGYKSAQAYTCTRVVQSRTFRVINKMATSYGY